MTGLMRSIGYHARRSKTVANFVIERAVPRKTGTPHHSKLAVRRNRSPRAQPSVSAGLVRSCTLFGGRLGGARRLKRVPDFVGRRRHVDMGDAERTQRIENCADHGRRCAGRPGFAGALEELVINLKTPAQSI